MKISKNITVAFIVMCMVLSLLVQSTAITTNKTLTTLKLDLVGFENITDKEISGPTSFYVDSSRIVYILDNNNHQILICKQNIVKNIIQYDSTIGGIDICVDKNGIIYVLTVDNVYTIDKLGHTIDVTSIPILDENSYQYFVGDVEAVGRYFPRFIDIVGSDTVITFQNYNKYMLQDGNIFPYTEDDKLSILDSQPSMKSGKLDKKYFEVSGEPLSIRKLQVDNNNNKYIEIIEESHNNVDGMLYDTIRILDYTNSLVGVATINTQNLYVPNRTVFITPDGIIYQMQVDESSISVTEVPKEKKYTKKQSSIARNKTPISDVSQMIATRSSYQSLYRWEVGQSGFYGYIEEDWTYNSLYNNVKSITGDPNEVTQPHYLTQYNDQQDHLFTGMIPYCWGGSDWGIDVNYRATKRSPNHLYFAGNIDAKYSNGQFHNYISYTTGVDCSGLISNIFRLPTRLGTSDMMLSTSPFERKGTWSGGRLSDILLKNGHVMLLNSYITANGQVTGAIVFESTTRNSVDQVLSQFQDAAYCSTFDLYRYRYFLD